MRYQPPTFRVSVRQQLLLLMAVAMLLIASAIVSFEPRKAGAATSSTINFQARLMTGAGGIVPDGFYNVEFKIYSQSSGGAAAWTETYYDSNGVTAGNDNRVRVANGYLTVNLGSITPFGAINWDQDFWISMNVGGSAQTATPTWDGEMDPRLKLTAVPYAFRAGQLAKLTGSNTSTLSFDTQSAPNSILLPDEGGILCIRNSSQCGFVQGSTNNFIQNGTSVQSAANFNIRSSATGAVTGVLQGANGQTADLLQLQTYNGTTSTTVASFNSVGALSLNGTGTSLFTGGTGNFPAKINIGTAIYGSIGQGIAVGVDGDSDITAQGITVFDYRSNGNQRPSIGVYSPAESSSLGFSWRGGNSDGYVMTMSNTSSTAGIVLQSGDTVANSASTSGDVTIRSGNGSGVDSSSGDVIIDNGSQTGIGTIGSITLGATNSSAINIGRSGITTTVTGALAVLGGAVTINESSNNNTSINTGTSTGTVSIGNASAGSVTLQSGSSGTSLLSGGNVTIGVADANSTLLVLDSSSSETGTIAGSMYYNTSSGKFRCYEGGSWVNCINSAAGGVTTIGTIDSQTKSANGAVISGTTLYLQTADNDDVGLVSTGTQDFAGNKTFLGTVAVSPSTTATALVVTQAQGADGMNLNITGSSQTNGLLVNRTNAGTLTNGVNITNTSGTLTYGLAFSGTIGTDINRSSGILSLQGTGGVTVTAGGTTTLGLDTGGAGTISLAATNATAVNVGNAGTTVTLQGTVKVSTLGSATANTASVCRDTSTTNLISCDLNTTGRPFLQGGNTFGATGVLGTNDSNSLQVETNNIVRATFDTSNALYLGLGSTAAAPTNFTVAATGSATAGTSGATLTLQGGAGASATTGSAGGAITIAGGNAGGSGNNAGGNVVLQGGLDTNTGTPGSVLVKNSADSAVAFSVQNAAGTSTVFDVDSASGRVGIGTAAPTRQLHVSLNNSTVDAPPLLVEQAGAGDATMEFKNTLNSFVVGTDTSDSGKFKISSSAASGATFQFGNTEPTTIWTSDFSNQNTQNATEYVMGGTPGTVTSIGVYIVGGSAANQFSVAIYSNDTGFSPNRPGTPIATTAATNIIPNAINTVPISASLSAGTTYWLAFNTNDGTANMRYEAGGADTSCFVSRTFALGWASPFGGCTSSNQNFNMYVNVVSGTSVDSFGAALFSMTELGQTVFQNWTNSTTAFAVQNASATPIFNVDTTNGRVGINTAAPTADLSFGAGANRVINVLAQPTAATAGNNLTINSGQGNTTGAGGILTMQAGQGGATGAGGAAVLQGGSGGSTSGVGGAVTVRGGSAAGAFAGGLATLVGGTASATAGSNGGAVAVTGAAGSTTGTGGSGGGITLQGGNAGGSGNNTGGAISLTAGNSTGTTAGGGISLQAGTGGSSANGGTVSVTGGTGGAATRLGGAVTMTGGTGVTTGAGGALTLQGGTGGNAATGGVVTVQGGSAGGGNTNGANVNLVGGVGTGTGVKGLVVVDTATFSPSTTQSSATSANITQANIDSFGSIVLNATAASVTFTLSDPTLGASAAGRLIYVIAANGTNDFTLRANSGEGAGIEQNISMRQNTTATMIWTGTNWTAAGASSSTTLQSAYDSTLTSAGGAELVLNAPGGNADGLTVRNNGTTPIVGGLLEVQTSIGSNLLSVNNNATEYATNGGAETAGASSATFPATTWDTTTGGTVDRWTTAGDNVATGQASVRVQTTTTNHGARNRISASLTSGLTYTVSFAVRGATNFSTLQVLYSPDGTTTGTTQCATAQTVTSGIWTRITCSFVASGTITSSNSMLIRQTDATARTFYVDNLSINVNASATFAADGSVDNAGTFATNWTDFDVGTGSATITRETTVIYDTSASTAGATTANTGQGIRNNMAITPAINTQYLVSFYARSTNTMTSSLAVGFLPAGGTAVPSGTAACVDYNTQSLVANTWTKITCLFTTAGTAISNPDIVIYQTDATARTMYVDALSITLNTNNSNNVQVGGANKGGPVTLFTLDRSNGAPIAANNEAYLGSMYYDTTSGRIQCYEADGWGACGAAPDNIVNLNPEYAGAVLNGGGIGTMTADFCSNDTALTVNSTLCSTGQARNFYKWTSPQATQQTYSIYVTYQLPATFNGFSSDDTVQLVARVDNTSNAAITYEMFKSTGSAVTKCGTGETDVITGGGGSANTWYSYGINGNESTGCSFNSASAGNFVIFKINLKANSNANAYVSTLSFTTTGR